MIDNNLIYANACQAELKVIREDKSQVEFPRTCKTKLAQDRHIRTCLKGQFSIVSLYSKSGTTGYNIVFMIVK